jgi:L-ascorbate metabolism protein UlaG (beta-lactamase superfamily)
MQVEWYGQSAFALSRRRHDRLHRPFATSGRWRRAACAGSTRRSRASQADLLLVTHEHSRPQRRRRHRRRSADAALDRRRLESPIGEVLAVASEHDAAAGTERGPNTLFAFTSAAGAWPTSATSARPTARGAGAALGSVDLLFVPIGGGPTIGAEQATAIAARLSARVVVPMHYRTERIDFLEPVDAFAALAAARRAPAIERVRPRRPARRRLPARRRARRGPDQPLGDVQRSAAGPTPHNPD